jgi:hypothetical protein
MSLEILEQALLSEDVSVVDEILNLIQETKDNGHYVPKEIDEMTIRKMLIKNKMIEKEIEKKKEYKQAILDSWNKQIEKLEKEYQNISDIILYYLQEKNNGKSISFDVATVSARKVSDGIEVEDKKSFEQFLLDNELRNEFLKEPEVDFTKAKNQILNQIKQDNPFGITNDVQLPQGLKYKPERKSLSIKFNK